MTTFIALIRGINVGRAKRIAMADLRSLVEDLGCTDVRTLLNSGNVVGRAMGRSATELASAIETGISRACGFEAAVLVLPGRDLNRIVAEQPFAAAAEEPTRHLVAFVKKTRALGAIEALLAESWEPEAAAVGSKAAYLACPLGIAESRLGKAVSATTGDGVTMRNWRTVLKLQEAVEAMG